MHVTSDTLGDRDPTDFGALDLVRRRRDDGPVTRFRLDGRRAREEHLREGVRHGPTAGWYANGASAFDGEWRGGLPHGMWRLWWPDGRPQLTGAFTHGEPAGVWHWIDRHGDTAYKGPWHDGLAALLPPEVTEAMGLSGPS